MAVPLTEGARVVVQAKPAFWTKRGTLQLDARQVRPVGVGELLARLEHLKRVLAAEGLFERGRKKPLPFLPRRVGLICGRASAAEKDVVENARRRWPTVVFEIREVAVQGRDAVTEVSAALRELDRDRAVDVIVIARGGGAFEDLLPFSNEALVRAVAAARDPRRVAPSATTSTPPCWTSSPTGGRRRRPTPPSWWCPTLAEQRAAVAATAGAAAPRRRHARRLRAAPPGVPALPTGDGRPDRDDRRPPPGARRAHRALPPPGAGRACTAPLTRSATCGRRSGPCPRCPPSSAGMPWCSTRDGRVVMDQAATSRRTSCCGCGWPGATSACARSPGPRRPASGAAMADVRDRHRS